MRYHLRVEISVVQFLGLNMTDNKKLNSVKDYFAFAAQRCSSSPILMGLLSVAVVWMAVFMAISNFSLLRKLEQHALPEGWTPPPPAPRNLEFEKRIGLVKHPHDKDDDEETTRFKLASAIHGFNVKESEKIGTHIRTLPDTIPEMCKAYALDSMKKVFPTVSVIITFHNEHFTTLARTIMSTLHRTPERILHEIILVDDGNDDAELSDKLKPFLEKAATKTKLFSVEHSGIVNARLKGANEATGEVLVFMESHAEPNVEWIEPLLILLEHGKSQGDKITLAVPALDIIDDETFRYRATPALRGGFEWDLVFRWEFSDKMWQSADHVKFIQSPAFSGGVFAVYRESFMSFGSYDDEMHDWGAENIELSLRVGMCGGRILVTPCSRVGHVFRRKPPMAVNVQNDQKHDNNYWFAHNALRTALVWLVDEGIPDGNKYLSYFYRAVPEARHIESGSVKNRKELRKNLMCKTFQWFLENIYPDFPQAPTETSDEIHNLNLERPIDSITSEKSQLENLDGYKRRTKRSGHLFHLASGMCLTRSDMPVVKNVPTSLLPGDANAYSCLTLAQCEQSKSQLWHETWQGDFILDGIGGGCLTWGSAYSPAALVSLCPPPVTKPNKLNVKAKHSHRWRWLDGMIHSQLQVTVEGSALNEKCLVARHFPSLCDNERCQKGDSSTPARVNNVCGSENDPSEVVVEPCTSDPHQRFQLLDFTKDSS